MLPTALLAGRAEAEVLNQRGSGGDTRAGSWMGELLARYRRYLLLERELGPATIVGYVHRVRPFLAAQVTVHGPDLVGLKAAEVNAFVLADCGRRTRQSAKLTVTALQALLRFLHAEGAIGESLSEGVPSVAHWRLSGLPQHLELEQVRALFDSCDRTTSTGVRAFAILKLLVRLGLRRCEVTRLQLEDIDWRAGEVMIHGKRERHDRLPLPPDVGQAVADYLERVRPRGIPDRHVFIGLYAPHRALPG